MTRGEFTALFPRASEATIRANCTDAIARTGPISLPKVQKAGNAKETPSRAKPAGKRQRVPRTRNAGTWTEAQHFTRIRSCLRRMSMFWIPAKRALAAVRIPWAGPHGRKWGFPCAACGKIYARKGVQIDHIIPCGALTDYSHLPQFINRLLPENGDAFRIVCKSCHQAKTNTERAAK